MKRTEKKTESPQASSPLSTKDDAQHARPKGIPSRLLKWFSLLPLYRKYPRALECARTSELSLEELVRSRRVGSDVLADANPQSS